MEESTHWNGTD